MFSAGSGAGARFGKAFIVCKKNYTCDRSCICFWSGCIGSILEGAGHSGREGCPDLSGKSPEKYRQYCGKQAIYQREIISYKIMHARLSNGVAQIGIQCNKSVVSVGEVHTESWYQKNQKGDEVQSGLVFKRKGNVLYILTQLSSMVEKKVLQVEFADGTKAAAELVDVDTCNHRTVWTERYFKKHHRKRLRNGFYNMPANCLPVKQTGFFFLEVPMV